MGLRAGSWCRLERVEVGFGHGPGGKNWQGFAARLWWLPVAGGLGEAVSLDLAANGVKVAIVDRDAAAVEAIRAALGTSGADAITHVGDARERSVLKTLFAASQERWGRLDGLVNVVGGTFRAAFTDTNERARTR